MWIRNVDIPAELVAAHQAGELVLFVGAGASVDSPSNLPLFTSLAQQVAEQVRFDCSADDLAQPDVLLGRIGDRQVRVHELVAGIINAAGSAPNALHQGIVDLALSSPSPMVVTTNYDRHLESCWSTRATGFRSYRAPALPLGHRFDGLVYLHGSLDQQPEELVLTDSDFGHAYLREAWAARFLERMFTARTVLFIGYSVSDVVMRYLARALGPDGRRYVLTDKPHDPTWRSLGIKPVGYDVVEESHAALGEALGGWAELAAMGLLEHRARLADLLAAPPSLVPEEASYLEATLADVTRTSMFVDLARGPVWLSWATQQPAFAEMFRPISAQPEHTRVLARWFAREFAIREELSDQALGVVREAGGYLGDELWYSVAFELLNAPSPLPDWAQPWIAVLVQQAQHRSPDLLEQILHRSQWPDDRAPALLLLDHLLEPVAIVDHSYGGRTRFDVTLRGDRYWLNEAWTKCLRPHLPDLLHDVVPIVDRHLRRAYHLLDTAGFVHATFDPISYRRPRIEAHDQDRYRESIDVLIDVARDCMEQLCADNAANDLLATWTRSHVAILKRIGLHGWALRKESTDDEKVAFLCEFPDLHDGQLAREIIRLLKRSVPGTALPRTDALVARIVEDASSPETRTIRSVASLLAWISELAPLSTATAALEDFRAAHPDHAVRPPQEIETDIQVGWVPERLPFSVEEFEAMLKGQAAHAIDELRSLRGNSRFEGPSWDDALSLVRQTVSTLPQLGFVIADEAIDDRDLLGALIQGWAAAELANDEVDLVIAKLTSLPVDKLIDELTTLLADGGQRETAPTDWTLYPPARNLARDLWLAITDEDASAWADMLPSDALSAAINHPGGRLAEFWLHTAANDWRAAAETWDGLPESLRAPLEDMLGDPSILKAKMAEVIIGSQLHFFFEADEAWCLTHVLPLLGWTDAPRAQRVWNGYLTWGRFNDRLLAAGLADSFAEAVQHASDLGDDDRTQLFSRLAGIMLLSEHDYRDWLVGLLPQMTADGRVQLASQIAWTLRELSADAIEHQWQRWMHDYWKQRISSVPVELSFGEASAMAAWIPFLTESVSAGVAAATATPAGLGEHGDVLRQLTDDVLDRAPAAWARFVGHLLANTELPFWHGGEVARVVRRVRGEADPADLDAIFENAIRLGLGNPETW